ncbi:MAG: hypothetical protein JXA69_03900 [Phycisphaerae bacterium]|nr:hypothetical protein [Phycisphaerae bacterium]
MGSTTMDTQQDMPRSAFRPTLPALLFVLFAASGAAGLIYEIVWFQLLRLTIGANSQSLGVLLACFMGGLFLGSLFYARAVSESRHPLRVFALLELGIALMAIVIPYAAAAIRSLYFSWSYSPQTALLLRCAVCAVMLVPPTVLMGATLPALSRFVRSQQGSSATVGWLYAVNIMGAVIGVFTSVLFLLPAFGLSGANLVAISLNGTVALVAFGLSVAYRLPETAAETVVLASQPTSRLDTTILVAYGLNGLAALSLEVLWSRLLTVMFGATVLAFGMVLGLFLTGLSIGGVIGSMAVPKLANPRRAFAEVQIGLVGLVGCTSLVVPKMTAWFNIGDWLQMGPLWAAGLTDMIRAAMIILPATILWGMSFPLALASLGQEAQDPARRVGRLYACNTIGAVTGALLTSFVLIPRWGSATGAAHLVVLPLVTALVLCWPPRRLGLVPIAVAFVGVWIAFTDVPSRGAAFVREMVMLLDDPIQYVYLAILPAFLGFELFLIRRVVRRLSLGAALSGVALALGTVVPADFYYRGRGYGDTGAHRSGSSQIVLFEEGAMEPVVVARHPAGHLELSVIGQICASSLPESMAHLRLLGHVPVLLSADPSDVLVVGLGAGVTAGCAAIHENVERVRVAELEPKVTLAARQFAEVNHDAMDNPKVDVMIDDGRHFIATTDARFGVITSDPIEPFWNGSAALYTVEYYRLCRDQLISGGVFMQWLGIFGMDEEGILSLLAAFAEVFPDGVIWLSELEILLIGGTEPLNFDPAVLRDRLAKEPAVATSLAEVGIETVEQLLGHHVCSIATIGDDLAGIIPNRDDNLMSQYVGWRAYYQSGQADITINQLLDQWRTRETLPIGQEQQVDTEVP